VNYGTTAFKYVPYAKYSDKAGNTFSGDYNDLSNTPDFTGWDTNVSDDFDGNFTHLTNIPAGLNDGDDDTHLTETEVDNYVSNNGYLTSEIDGSTTNELQDLSLSGTQLNITNGTGVNFSGWDTDASDDVTKLNDLIDARAIDRLTFIGSDAGLTANSYSDLVGIGMYSLNAATSADYSVAVGNFSLKYVTDGSSNTAIGYATGYNLTHGSGNIFIGNSAGYHETGSNKLYIENSDSSVPLIGGDFSTDEVSINGSLSIKDGTEGKGKIFISDAAGKGHWSADLPQHDKVMVLSPVNALPSSNSTSIFKNEGYVNCSYSSSGEIFFPINLPEDAYLDYVTVFYVDNSSNNLDFELSTKGITNSYYSTVDSYTTIGTSSSFRFVSLNAQQYIGTNNCFAISIRPDGSDTWSGMMILGIKVYYKE